ncbi:MAG: 5-deoxy-glucuronate isomerase, partial [bacterium]
MAPHLRPKEGSGLRWIVKRKRQDLSLLDFGLVNLKKGEALRDGTKDEEMVFHLFGGSCSASGEGFDFKKVGDRDDVFGGKASALYIPPHTRYVIEAVTDLHAAICTAPAGAGGAPRVIRPKDVGVRKVGKGNWYREVHDVGVENLEAKSLIFG